MDILIDACIAERDFRLLHNTKIIVQFFDDNYALKDSDSKINLYRQYRKPKK